MRFLTGFGEAAGQEAGGRLLERLLTRIWILGARRKGRVAQCPRCRSIRLKRAGSSWLWAAATVPLAVASMVSSLLFVGGIAVLGVGAAEFTGIVETQYDTRPESLLKMLAGLVATASGVGVMALCASLVAAKAPVSCRACAYEWEAPVPASVPTASENP